MGTSSSKENVVTENMVQDESESFNEVNIHSPTANLGFSIAFGLVAVCVGYKVYKRLMYRCSSGGRKARAKAAEPQEPDQQTCTSVDMLGLSMQTAKEADDRCQDCLESSRLERAWRLGEGRRLKVPYSGGQQPAQLSPIRGRRVASRSPLRRPRSVDSF